MIPTSISSEVENRNKENLGVIGPKYKLTKRQIALSEDIRFAIDRRFYETDSYIECLEKLKELIKNSKCKLVTETYKYEEHPRDQYRLVFSGRVHDDWTNNVYIVFSRAFGVGVSIEPMICSTRPNKVKPPIETLDKRIADCKEDYDPDLCNGL